MSYKLVFDFTCRIEGQEDRIHMVQQRHNEGYGLVIRSEKDDIWERLSGIEAFRLEEKLLDEVEYRTYHNRIEKLDSFEFSYSIIYIPRFLYLLFNVSNSLFCFCNSRFSLFNFCANSCHC